LPLDEPTGVFRLVTSNTLIQHGGWTLIAAAVGVAASGFWVSQRNSDAWVLPVVLCVLAGIGIVIWATDKGLRTLYPVGADGAIDTSKPGVVASLGIALYVAGAGVAVALVGSLMLRQSGQAGGAEALDGGTSAGGQTKKCPDCAEAILADAKVCKHCGYRFALAAPDAPQVDPTGKTTAAPDAPQVDPTGKTTRVRCHNCHHVQKVPVSQSSFVCAQCNRKLMRTNARSPSAPSPKSTPATTPSINQSAQRSSPPSTHKPRPNTLDVGARVKVRAGEDDYDGKVGTVQTHLDDDGDGLTIGVIFKGDKHLYAFSPGELTVVKTDQAT
jgi:hypothetical protein